MNCVVIFFDVKLKKNRFPRINTQSLATRVRAKREQLKSVKDLYLKAKARIWPCLSYVCHVRSTAESLATSGPLSLRAGWSERKVDVSVDVDD